MRERILEADRAHVWHPYTPMDEYIRGARPLVIERARGARLWDVDGRSFLDGNASWWVAALGHNHPALVEAVRSQSERLCHVSLAGVTHEAAALLAEELVARCPGDLRRVFFVDDGSTAVEAAVKMCAQYWHQQGAPRKRRFLALEGAFHGETVGATSLGDVEVFRRPFSGLLFDCVRVPAPADEGSYEQAFEALARALEQGSDELAALVLEPLVQGASGMRFYPASFLARARALCDAHRVLLVADEVFTGYGRTGRFFACNHAGVTPDLLCVAKGFTGGVLPMGAVVAREGVFEGFFGGRHRAFLYGHSFCGNPLGAAVARAVLRVFEQERVLEGVEARAQRIRQTFERLAGVPGVVRARSLGMIGALDLAPRTGLPAPGCGPHEELDAIELTQDGGYLAQAGWRVYEEALERGAYLRPLGNVVYTTPPLNIPLDDLDELLAILEASVRAALGQ
ncbi:MAG: adenosylmethionine--8-amino-7-oxononanoate transaminase [Polyangiaceae bacterium]|nr:adenosylmethionine--8-amino-7-oxononanoate transaminase [Polyangiaceae bacterium]